MNFNASPDRNPNAQQQPDATLYSAVIAAPQSHSALFSLAWQLFKDEKQTLLSLFLFVYIPSTLFSNTLGRFDGMFSSDWLLNIVIFIISICIVMVAYVAIVQLTHSVVHKIHNDWRQTVCLSYPRLGRAIGNSALSTLYTLLWCVLLIVPGMIAALRYTFVLQATVIKGMDGHEALTYSKQLTKGRLKELFGILVVFLTFYIGVDFLCGLILTFAVPFIGSFCIDVLSSLIAGTLEIFYVIFMTLWFINLDFTDTLEASE